jgi:hypothetical protein
MTKVMTLACIVAMLVGCSQKGFYSNVRVNPHPVPDVDFAAYSTWNFGREGQYPPTGNETLDSPQFRASVAAHFAEEMTAAGYTRNQESPAILMLLHVVIEEKFDEQKMDDIYKGYDMAWAQMGPEDYWKQGSLIIFAVDAKTGQQVWSSTAEAKLQENVGFDERRQRFNNVVSMMLADFPQHAR